MGIPKTVSLYDILVWKQTKPCDSRLRSLEKMCFQPFGLICGNGMGVTLNTAGREESTRVVLSKEIFPKRVIARKSQEVFANHG
jgi:hypothetical protein